MSVCNYHVMRLIRLRPKATYSKQSPISYDVEIHLNGQKKPFLLVFSNGYNTGWDLTLTDLPKSAITSHITANGYANGWTIDPARIGHEEVLRGRIYLTFQNYFYIGSIVSVATLIIVIFLALREIMQKEVCVGINISSCFLFV